MNEDLEDEIQKNLVEVRSKNSKEGIVNGTV